MPFRTDMLGFTGLTPAIYKAAKDFFIQHPAEKYISRKTAYGKFYKFQNSFIYDREKDILYAVEDTHTLRSVMDYPHKILKKNQYHLGRGSCGKVKRVLSDRNELHAVKVSENEDPMTTEKVDGNFAKISRLFFSFLKNRKPNKTDSVDKLYRIIKLEAGVNMFEYKRKNGTLTLLERTQVAIAVMKKSHWLHHDKKYIHGDLKDENIMLNRLPDGSYEASFVDVDHSLTMEFCETGIGHAASWGTRIFIAPEIQRCRENKISNSCSFFSVASDLYSLGVMFFGDFIDQDKREFDFRSHNKHSLFKQSEIDSEPQLKILFYKMCDRNPKNRLSDLAVLAALEAYAASLPPAPSMQFSSKPSSVEARACTAMPLLSVVSTSYAKKI